MTSERVSSSEASVAWAKMTYVVQLCWGRVCPVGDVSVFACEVSEFRTLSHLSGPSRDLVADTYEKV